MKQQLEMERNDNDSDIRPTAKFISNMQQQKENLKQAPKPQSQFANQQINENQSEQSDASSNHE